MHGANEMHVIVDEARDDRSTRKVDHPGIGSDLFFNVDVAAHRNDAFAVNRQGLGDGEIVVDRQDPAIAKHLFGMVRLFGLASRQDHRRRRHQDPGTMCDQTPDIRVIYHICFICICYLFTYILEDTSS